MRLTKDPKLGSLLQGITLLESRYTSREAIQLPLHWLVVDRGEGHPQIAHKIIRRQQLV